jgi:uncharacterized protein
MTSDRFGQPTLAFLSLVQRGRLADAAQHLTANSEIITDRDAIGETPLHWLAIESDVAGVRLLIERGADVNTQDEFGNHVVYHAASVASIETLQALLAAGGDPNARTSVDDGCALYAAATRKDDPEKFVDALLAAGADLEARDSLGSTPLARCASFNNVSAIRLLAARDADLNATNNHGEPVLHESIKYGSGDAGMGDVIQALLQLGADPNRRDANDATALHVAVENACAPQLIDSLISAGADVEALDAQHHTPPLHAANCGNIAAALCLHDHGANMRARCRYGLSFLRLVPDDQRDAWRDAFEVGFE